MKQHSRAENSHTARFLACAFSGLMLLALGWSAAGLIPAAQFQRERIEITIQPDSILVHGLYVYANPLPWPLTQGLRVPFPLEKGQAPPATVTVRAVDPQTGEEGAPLQVMWIGGNPHFSVRIPARGSSWVRLRFEQYTPQHSATYLLTTTQPWGRPLESGEYFLHPRGVQLTNSSYPFDQNDCLCFRRRNFMPEQEWRFSWLLKKN